MSRVYAIILISVFRDDPNLFNTCKSVLRRKCVELLSISKTNFGIRSLHCVTKSLAETKLI